MKAHEQVEHRDVDVGDGLRLHATITGDGGRPALLLLHGFTGSAETWTPIREALARQCTTIAVDMPGHGRSTSPANPARYALPRFADDLAHLLAILGYERAAALGYSMGGRAALQLALRHPASVVALVLESTSPGIADEKARRERVAADEALAMSIERDGIDAFVERWEALPLWATQQALPAEARGRLRAQRRSNRAEGLANSLRGAGTGVEPSVAAQLSSLHMPALVVAGALDVKYAEIGKEMARLLPNARLAIVPETGHAVHLEAPAQLASAMMEFLSEVAAVGQDEPA